MDHQDVSQALRRVPFLRTLREPDFTRIAGLTTVRHYLPGKTIVCQDDTAISLYCVVNGTVRVEHHQSDGDRTVVLAQLGPGGFFGEMSLLDDHPRSASAIAVTDTDCALLTKWDFHHELRTHPRLALSLMRLLSERIRELDEKIIV
jgi:CRP/FNR family cyclic AMP-dependent transcriptional regulator